VVEFFAGRQWKELDAEKQAQLLRWFLEAVDLVGTIHEQGFVHRDVTDTNFILGGDGRLCIIDFELSYNIRLEKPDPPFLLGTYGYAAPEQLQYAVPDFSEDVYSLGALLCFMLTGIKPVELLHQDHHQNRARLCRLTGESGLSRLAFGCLNEKRQCRPTLKALRDGVNHHLTILNLTAI
jgi:serine/threonine protein kinase